MPTSEWKAATSSGIEVIGTRRAITAPAPPPSAMPATTRAHAETLAGGCAASVLTVRETSTSPAPASEATRAPMCTAMPLSSLPGARTPRCAVRLVG